MIIPGDSSPNVFILRLLIFIVNPNLSGKVEVWLFGPPIMC